MVCLGPGRGVLPYLGYIGMCGAKRVWFYSCFGLKWNINFDHFGPRLLEGRLYINFRSPQEPGA